MTTGCAATATVVSFVANVSMVHGSVMNPKTAGNVFKNVLLPLIVNHFTNVFE